jgi:hypothetical protein
MPGDLFIHRVAGTANPQAWWRVPPSWKAISFGETRQFIGSNYVLVMTSAGEPAWVLRATSKKIQVNTHRQT